MSLRDVTRKALGGMRRAQTTREQLDEGVRDAEKVVHDHAKGLLDGHHKALTDIARDPALRGTHFKHVEKAAQNLHKRGVIHFDGNHVSPTAKTDVKEGATLDEGLHNEVHKTLAHHGMDGSKLYASSGEGYNHLHAALAKHNLALDDHIHDHGGSTAHSQNYRLKKMDGTPVHGTHLHVTRTGGVGDREGVDGSDHPMKGRHEFNAYLHGKKLKEGATDEAAKVGALPKDKMPEPKQAGPSAKVKGGITAPVKRADGRVVHVFVPTKEAAEPSFAARMLAAAKGEQPVAEAAPEVPASLVASLDAVEAAGMDEAALAAFGLVEAMKVEEIAANDEHHVDVHYRLHGSAAAKSTVHHLIAHAKKHGAHGYDAEGYDGHIRFKFKDKGRAHAFHKLAGDARDVHKATVGAHANESYHPDPKRTEAYDGHHDAIEDHLNQLRHKLRAHMKEYNEKGHWGHVGDVEHVHKTLKALNDHFMPHHKESAEADEPEGKLTEGVEATADLAHPRYNTAHKSRGWTDGARTARQTHHADRAADAIKKSDPHLTKADHVALAKAHHAKAKEHDKHWGETVDKAHHEKYGKKWSSIHYKVSGVGDSDYAEHHKEKLRHHAHSASEHRTLAHAHAKLARVKPEKLGLHEHVVEGAAVSPAPAEPAPALVPADKGKDAPAPTGGFAAKTVVVRVESPMGEAHEDMATLLHVFGGKAGQGGYVFPAQTAQAFVNKLMVNGGKAHIVGPNGEKHGPNEDADDLPGFDPLAEGREAPKA